MIAYHYSWLHGWQCIGAQKRQTKYATNTSCYCKFSSFSHILKCHPQSLPALIHHVNLMSSSRAIHQSLTIALFCSCTHYQRVLAACHKHSVFYSQSGGKGKIYANTKWRIHLSCALSFKSKLVLEMLSYDYEPINVYLKKKKNPLGMMWSFKKAFLIITESGRLLAGGKHLLVQCDWHSFRHYRSDITYFYRTFSHLNSIFFLWTFFRGTLTFNFLFQTTCFEKWEHQWMTLNKWTNVLFCTLVKPSTFV